MMGVAVRLAVLTLFATLLTMVNGSAESQCDVSAAMSRMEQKLTTMELENRMVKLESRLANMELETRRPKVEREGCEPDVVENSTCTPQVSRCPETTNSNVTKTLENMAEKLADVVTALEKLNISGCASKIVDSYQKNESKQPDVCERGMNTSVTEKFVLIDNDVIGKEIRCDAKTDGGGWIVFMRRATGDVDFYRPWAEYREGFGNLTGDFWLGNEAVYNLTNEDAYEMRIDFVINGQKKFARYSSFKIESESAKYTLRIGSYSGTVGQTGKSGMAYSNGAPFSTLDRNHNGYWQGNCAVVCRAAWWYTKCHRANLLGLWGSTEIVNTVRWNNGKQWLLPTFIEMKIRRIYSYSTISGVSMKTYLDKQL